MALRKTDIDRLEIREKRYLVHDGNGLYLEVMPSGKKIWRLRFQNAGKVRNLTLGEYPKLGIKDARLEAVRKRDEAAFPRGTTQSSSRMPHGHSKTFDTITGRPSPPTCQRGSSGVNFPLRT